MRVLSSDELDLLRLLLVQASRPDIVKPALQRLCGLLEDHVYFSNRSAVRQLVLPLLYNKSISVRRWATKAVAYLGLGNSVDEDYLLLALGRETDRENRSWFIAAIGTLSPELQVLEVCDRAHIELTKEYELAKRLYRSDPKPLGAKFIDIESDLDATLIWLTLLEGYGRNPDDIAHDKYNSSEIVRQLVSHSNPTVSEYSVWALWKNSGLGYRHLLLAPSEFESKPADVRRWIYRLFASEEEIVHANLDLLQQMSVDRSVKAREGAAMGIATMRSDKLAEIVNAWLSEEQEPRIRDALFEHMALNSPDNNYFSSVVTEEFKEHGSNNAFRARMLVSAAGTPLLNDLRAIQVREQRRKHELATGRQFDMFYGETPMTNNYNFFGNVANFVAGNQRIDTDSFEQSFSFSGFDADALAAVIEQAKKQGGEVAGEALIADINEVAKSKDSKSVKSLKDRLTTLSNTVTAGTSAAIAIDKLKEVLEGWIG